jgi:nucleoid-associated protein YgaU
MSLQDKYSSVISLAQQLNVKELKAVEQADTLQVSGTTNTQYEKNLIWDKIKEIGGEAHPGIKANLTVSNTDYYHLHNVVGGESLSKISKKYYRDANKYMKIFDANKDQLKDPNLIKVGQQLKIPNP